MSRFWTEIRHLRPRAPILGTFVASLVAVVAVSLPEATIKGFHERTIDALLTAGARVRWTAAPTTGVVVVDIDQRSLTEIGSWPWPRRRMADLVDSAARSGARAVAIDILFDGADAKSPATLARRLGDQIHRPDIVSWADELEDGDASLAAALASAPVSLGFALDPSGRATVPTVPFLISGPIAVPGIWQATGAIGPFPRLLAKASGLGTLALAGDEDGVVRRVPLLVAVAGRLHPGLAAEAVRLAQGASAYHVDGAANRMAIGDVVVPLPRDGMLRLHPSRPAITTISAADLLGRSAPDSRLAGAIVLIGGSAPELGGLRPASGDPLTPSVILLATAIFQLIAGIVPLAISFEAELTMALAIIAIGVGVTTAMRLHPLRGALALLAFVALVVVAALAGAMNDRLFDPSLPIVLAVTAFLVTALMKATETQLREAHIRHRFSQHLSPAVVERIASSPSMLKLAGERREITALFTDVEGFTAMTHRAGPEALVALLDEYFEGVIQIVIDHGGMIDKLVGDAVHAFFNMPLDLPDHPAKAVACAVAIHVWTEAYRRRPFPAEMQFGRTRIGIETGDAIVGDIGIRSKLDYTAHGDTVNAAARLEAANKAIGSAICVGPVAASRCPPDMLRPTGVIQVPDFAEPIRTWEPWGPGASADWRRRYLLAADLSEADAADSAQMFDQLAAEQPGDAVPVAFARRLRDGR